jgi:acetyltransferase-like isoleucine patch superfamily enzyme
MGKLTKFIKKPNSTKILLLQRQYQYIYKRFSFKSFGKGSVIQKPLLLSYPKYITVGKNCLIRKNIRLEPVEAYGNENYYPNIIIGNNTSIEQNCHIVSAKKVNIGNNVTISAFVFITDLDHGHELIDTHILNQPISVKETSIGDYSFVGIGAKVMAGVKIGKQCIIGANSVVTKDIPDYSVVVGIPARIIKRYNFDTKAWEKTNSKGEFIKE